MRKWKVQVNSKRSLRTASIIEPGSIALRFKTTTGYFSRDIEVPLSVTSILSGNECPRVPDTFSDHLRFNSILAELSLLRAKDYSSQELKILVDEALMNLNSVAPVATSLSIGDVMNEYREHRVVAGEKGGRMSGSRLETFDSVVKALESWPEGSDLRLTKITGSRTPGKPLKTLALDFAKHLHSIKKLAYGTRRLYVGTVLEAVSWRMEQEGLTVSVKNPMPVKSPPLYTLDPDTVRKLIYSEGEGFGFELTQLMLACAFRLEQTLALDCASIKEYDGGRFSIRSYATKNSKMASAPLPPHLGRKYLQRGYVIDRSALPKTVSGRNKACNKMVRQYLSSLPFMCKEDESYELGSSGEVVRTTAPAWELVTTHILRRSGATYLRDSRGNQTALSALGDTLAVAEKSYLNPLF